MMAPPPSQTVRAQARETGGDAAPEITDKTPPFSLVLLGTGTCVPRLFRGSASVLVKAGNSRILVDCGLGATHALLRHGVDPTHLDAIVLTHFHPDHTTELPGLLFSMKYPVDRQRSREIPVYGGAGLHAFMAGLDQAWGRGLDVAGKRFGDRVPGRGRDAR